jgi:chromate transporter
VAELTGHAEESAPAPVTLTACEWLWFHLKIGLFGFGHGSVMPMFERALVREHKLMTPAQFNEALTVSLVLPGPGLVTLSMYLGKELFGAWIGLLGALCMCIPGAVWALVVVYAVPLHHPAVRALFQGFTVGALVLLANMLWRLQRGLHASASAPAPIARHKVLLRLAISGALAALLSAHVPMATVAGLGVLACLAAEFTT